MFQSYFRCKYYEGKRNTESNAGNSLVPSSPSVKLSFRVREEAILEDEAGRGKRENRSVNPRTSSNIEN